MLGAASGLVFIAMLSSFTPTPLYSLYQERWGTSAAWVSGAFAAYAVGVLVVLVLLGGLSDRWGRRRTLLVAAVMIGASLTTLAFAVSPELVVVGRVLQGFGTALTAGAAAAALMELHPRGLQAGAVLNTVSLSLGCALGPFAAGWLAERTSHPAMVPYLAVAALLSVPVWLLSRMGGTEPPRGGARLVQRIRVPRKLLVPFLLAAVAVVSTNTSLGIYGSFGSVLAGAAGFESRSATGGLVSGVFAALTMAQVAARRWQPVTSIVAGAGACAAGWLVSGVGLHLGLSWIVVGGSLMVGAGGGLALMGSATLIGSVAPDGARAELYSAYLCVAFFALGCSALLAGAGLSTLTALAFVGCLTAATVVLAVSSVVLARQWSRQRSAG